MLRIFPLIFFAALLLSRAQAPSTFVFDEIHYVPAAKALITLKDNLNWEHPPLAKLILGAGSYVLSDTFHLADELTVLRWITIFFGLWTLWGVRTWLRTLGFSEKASQCGLILTGFNFLWFVHSKTVMLDSFFLAFSVWGLLDLWRARPPDLRALRGWIFLGFALACKWAAAPYFLLPFFFSHRTTKSPYWLRCVLGIVVAMFCYLACFIPLGFLNHNAVPLDQILVYHQRILAGQQSISATPHPYVSHWWQWPTLIRPMWYLFESQGGTVRGIWAGGNPALYWLALPFLFLLPYMAVRRKDQAARVLTLLFWAPLLFWALAPRKLQMYYYYLPSSIWVGPIVVWAHEAFKNKFPRLRQARGWFLYGFVLLCGALFFYFLPIMDARQIPFDRYPIYMWLRSWI